MASSTARREYWSDFVLQVQAAARTVTILASPPRIIDNAAVYVALAQIYTLVMCEMTFSTWPSLLWFSLLTDTLIDQQKSFVKRRQPLSLSTRLHKQLRLLTPMQPIEKANGYIT